MIRLHFNARPNKRNARGEPLFELGVRVGYWPCLRAPFVTVSLGLWRVSVWFGLPSYRY